MRHVICEVYIFGKEELWEYVERHQVVQVAAVFAELHRVAQEAE